MVEYTISKSIPDDPMGNIEEYTIDSYEKFIEFFSNFNITEEFQKPRPYCDPSISVHNEKTLTDVNISFEINANTVYYLVTVRFNEYQKEYVHGKPYSQKRTTYYTTFKSIDRSFVHYFMKLFFETNESELNNFIKRTEEDKIFEDKEVEIYSYGSRSNPFG